MSGGKGGGGGCGGASCDFYNGYASTVKTGSRYELGVSPTFIEAAVRQGRRRRDVNVETNLKSLRNGGYCFEPSLAPSNEGTPQPPGKFFPTTSHNLPTNRSLAYHVHAGRGKRSLSAQTISLPTTSLRHGRDCGAQRSFVSRAIPSYMRALR